MPTKHPRGTAARALARTKTTARKRIRARVRRDPGPTGTPVAGPPKRAARTGHAAAPGAHVRPYDAIRDGSFTEWVASTPEGDERLTAELKARFAAKDALIGSRDPASRPPELYEPGSRVVLITGGRLHGATAIIRGWTRGKSKGRHRYLDVVFPGKTSPPVSVYWGQVIKAPPIPPPNVDTILAIFHQAVKLDEAGQSSEELDEILRLCTRHLDENELTAVIMLARGVIKP